VGIQHRALRLLGKCSNMDAKYLILDSNDVKPLGSENNME
jgi:hypothetical protein